MDNIRALLQHKFDEEKQRVIKLYDLHDLAEYRWHLEGDDIIIGDRVGSHGYHYTPGVLRSDQIPGMKALFDAARLLKMCDDGATISDLLLAKLTR